MSINLRLYSYACQAMLYYWPMGTNRERNRRGNGDRLRDEIIGSAAEIIAERGDANAVTLRAVARGAGVSAPAIYAHFANPEAILLAVVEREFDGLTAAVQTAIGQAGEDEAGQLLACCRAYLQYAQDRPRQYAVMFGGVWDAAIALAASLVERDDVANLGQPLLTTLIELLQAAISSGQSTSTDARTDGIALWAGMHGLAHQRIVSTAMDWPSGIEDRLIRRLAYLDAQPLR